MSKKIAGPEIERLVALLSRMPGLGPRSARKAALALIKKREDLLMPLADAMRVARATGAVYELATGLVSAPVSDTSGEITDMSAPSPVRPGARVPDAYSASEIRSRISRGYHGGV